ncbi:MAG: type II/IV secretion system ATPase subunit [Nitrososphaeria archaeon]
MSREQLISLNSFPHLIAYIKRIEREIGSPTYVGTEIPDTLKKNPIVNIIYLVDKNNGIFVHVYSNPGISTGYRKYVVIEPPRPPQALFDLIEIKLAEVITEKDVATSPEERKKILLDKIKKIVEPTENSVNYEFFLAKNKIPKRIPVQKSIYNVFEYYLIRDKVGLGKLEPLIKDPYIEDISCSGVGCIHIVHKIFGSLETNICFPSIEELNKFIQELGERTGKPVGTARPIIDATLPDGSRLNAVFGNDVSLKGSNFTIRKFTETPISITRLIGWNTLDSKVAAFLWMLLLEGMSGFISGETASGKTTTLNASLVFIRPNAKIISIEDTAEVMVPHQNWVRELTRDTGNPETSVTMFDLLKAALRQRPNYIIVGEIRGAEGNIAFQAMQTGHPVIATFHAASVERLIQRIISPPINVPRTQLDNLNFILIQSAVYREGIMVRRVLSLNEIIGYNPVENNVMFVPAFTWDPVKDIFVFRGKGSSYLLEEKIGVARGLSKKDMNMIYEELELRAKILKGLAEKKVFDHFTVFKFLTQLYTQIDSKAKVSKKSELQYIILEGLERVLKDINYDRLGDWLK